MMHINDEFLEEVVKHSGDDFRRCLQCMSCAGGCPVVQSMAYRPNGVIRLIQFGEKEKVLSSADVWLCMGCNTCSVAYPMAIDIPGLMDALREIAIEENREFAEPAIVNFHREVLNSIKRYGRAHKLEIMLRYKVRQRDVFSDMKIGIQMMSKRKLDFLPSRIEHPEVISGLFAALGNRAKYQQPAGTTKKL